MSVPFLCVFLAFLLNYGTKLPVAWAMAAHGRKHGRGYDNRHPREQQAKLEGWGKRAHAAHLNSFEIFSGFAAAVVLAHLSSVDPQWMSGLSLLFVISRLVYIALYIGNLPSARSSVWFVGFLSVCGLFVLALL